MGNTATQDQAVDPEIPLEVLAARLRAHAERNEDASAGIAAKMPTFGAGLGDSIDTSVTGAARLLDTIGKRTSAVRQRSAAYARAVANESENLDDEVFANQRALEHAAAASRTYSSTVLPLSLGEPFDVPRAPAELYVNTPGADAMPDYSYVRRFEAYAGTSRVSCDNVYFYGELSNLVRVAAADAYGEPAKWVRPDDVQVVVARDTELLDIEPVRVTEVDGTLVVEFSLNEAATGNQDLSATVRVGDVVLQQWTLTDASWAHVPHKMDFEEAMAAAPSLVALPPMYDVWTYVPTLVTTMNILPMSALSKLFQIFKSVCIWYGFEVSGFFYHSFSAVTTARCGKAAYVSIYFKQSESRQLGYLFFIDDHDHVLSTAPNFKALFQSISTALAADVALSLEQVWDMCPCHVPVFMSDIARREYTTAQAVRAANAFNATELAPVIQGLKDATSLDSLSPPLKMFMDMTAPLVAVHKLRNVHADVRAALIEALKNVMTYDSQGLKAKRALTYAVMSLERLGIRVNNECLHLLPYECVYVRFFKLAERHWCAEHQFE